MSEINGGQAVTAIHLATEGGESDPRLVVEVEVDGKWQKVISEAAPGLGVVIGHIVKLPVDATDE